ncbi:hypothetical protein [Halomonas caseinilytica]|uniref:Uncharacterized protein n=1 Tax=Halomonas caseinilytica TaxID=438744 RepID=A0A1M6T6M3_9GAMM|nr:hypothetical protein [Halomonas caseinilytica]SHK52651.1 hypothetical protein SAMN05192556_103234 [Halomonas caseinilytica]
MNTAIAEVLAERHRQVNQEGWSHEHDDSHHQGELAAAAGCYALHTCLMGRGKAQDTVPSPWPWDASWWKPTIARRNLIKAAALILAEIERLDRAAAKSVPPSRPLEEAWSRDGVMYSHDSFQELIECHAVEPGSTVYTGTKTRFAPSHFADADSVIEEMGERACDEGGEFAEDFPDPTPEAREQLQILMNAWADLHTTIDFFIVEDAREYVITERDLEVS